MQQCQIPRDSEANAGAGHGAVKPNAAREHVVGSLPGNSRPIIIDCDFHVPAAASRREEDPAARPFPGIVEEVSEQVIEIAPVNAHRRIRREDRNGPIEPILWRQALHHANKMTQHRFECAAPAWRGSSW